MTFEKRCTVEPSDVLAICFECGACGTSTRIPIATIASAKAPNLLTTACIQCGEATGIAQGTLEKELLSSFLMAIGSLAKSAQGRNIRIKMELRCADLEVKS